MLAYNYIDSNNNNKTALLIKHQILNNFYIFNSKRVDSTMCFFN